MAFALWDERKEQLILSRDRIGEKPLHYAKTGGTFLFASEIKSILAYGLPRHANLDVLEIYLTLGYVPAPFSFVKDVHKLPPGHYAIVRNGRIRLQRYWDMPELDEANMLTSREEVFEQFQSLFYDSIRIRMRSDVSYGAFLSGGLDSSSIVAVMSKISGHPVETFTSGFNEKDFDERSLAQDVADRFETNHHEHTGTPDSFEENISRILYHFDEPFGDSSAIPTGYVSMYARESVKMVLTGDGRDETLSGYNAYQSEKFASQYQRLPCALRAIPTRLSNSAARLLGGRRMTRLARILRTADLALNERLLAKAAWAEIGLVRRLLRPLAARVIPVDDYLKDFMDGCSYKDNFYRLMYYHFKLTLPDDMLTKIDRMSMAYSLEARVLFLDYRLVEFMARVHKDVKMQGYERKSVLRRTVGRSLPRSILRAPKRGFVVPLREWFKDKRRTAALMEPSSKGPLEASEGGIDEILTRNASGRADYGNFIWMLFLLGTWLKV